MRFSVQNLNFVKKADIELNGLTVIVGENSSGKSTVARMLFSTIKSLNCTSESDRSMQKHLTSMYKHIYGYKNENEINQDLFPMPPYKFVEELRNTDSLDEFITKRLDYIYTMDIPPRIKELIKRDFENISILFSDSGKAGAFATEMQYLIESEFINEIKESDEETKIWFDMEDNKSELTYTINSDVVNEVSIRGTDFLKDATYIESPLYLHTLDSILNSTNYREISTTFSKKFRPMVPAHILDFANKIDSLKILNKSTSSLMKINCDNITGGKFIYDAKKRKLLFKQGENELSPINVSSGIKTFGIIQMLLDADFLSPNKMLIWDEPENHLHPAWQVEFASVLVQLAKNGIPVLITTHSPYFLQAIRFYSAKNKLEKYVNYYSAEIDENHITSNILNKTDTLNDVFTKLAAPLNNIMNIDEVRELD